MVAVGGSCTPICFPAREPVVAIEEGVDKDESFLCSFVLRRKSDVFGKSGRRDCMWVAKLISAESSEGGGKTLEDGAV